MVHCTGVLTDHFGEGSLPDIVISRAVVIIQDGARLVWFGVRLGLTDCLKTVLELVSKLLNELDQDFFHAFWNELN